MGRPCKPPVGVHIQLQFFYKFDIYACICAYMHLYIQGMYQICKKIEVKAPRYSSHPASHSRLLPSNYPYLYVQNVHNS